MRNVRKNSGGASVDTFSTINNNFLNTENRMARVNLDTSPAYLNGQSAALTFDAIEITDSTQYSSFKNPKILPNIESGTTESSGTDADTSETATIRVYDKNTADIRMANNDRILLDTWTVSISADGSVKEVNAK